MHSLKNIFFALGFLIPNAFLIAQHDVLSPIGYRYELEKKTLTTKSTNTIDGLFVYNPDTLTFNGVLIDDFSENHFQQYSTDQTAPNVSTESYFALLDLNDVPLDNDAIFTTIKTYLINITLQPVITRDTVWFDAISVKYNNLQEYPVTYNTIDVYPRYILIDTLDLQKPAPDTLWINANLRSQDFAEVFLVDLNDPNACWLDDNAHWNFTRAHLPWSLGVVTFDGMDANGWPYAINTSQVGYADYLTSKPFHISGINANNLYLTFLYQPQGFGDIPESNDSLIVDFFNVDNQTWETVWNVAGSPLHEFKIVHLPIDQPKYLQSGFQFRFKNYGGLSGDLDNWHIDYVRLKSQSASDDTTIIDFAGVYPITSLLKTYTNVPWNHYRDNPTGHMNTNMNITIRNSNIIAGNTQNGNLRIFDEGNLDKDYLIAGGSLTTDLNFNPKTTYTTTHNLSQLDATYNFPTTSPNDTSYCFDYHFTASVPFAQPVQHQNNDTIRGKQCFTNYYAYDDGSAEQAYGINGEQARLAYQFTTLDNDSTELVAVQMHFVPTVFDHSNKLFLLTVWGDNNGQPGEVLFQDDFFTAQSPVYMHEKNLFYHYYFRDMETVKVPSTYYVGWRQIDPQRLNIGFDKNTNSQNKIFYSVDLGATWLNSSFEGSLMIRPVVSSNLDYLLDIEELTPENLSLFPNPIEDEINFSYAKEGVVQFYTSDGKLIKTSNWETKLDTKDLTPGFYLLRVSSRNGDLEETFKIIKR